MKKILSALADEKESASESINLAEVNDLISAMDNYIMSNVKPRYRKSTGFSPSDDNPCIRYWWYKFTGIEFPVNHDARTQRIFDVGNDVEARLLNYFEGMGVLIGTQVPVPQREGLPPVSGFIDAIIEWDGPVIVEIKSIKHEGFLMRKNYKKPVGKHYRQIQWYMHYYGVDRGIVIYECKNTQELLVFKIKRDDDFCEKQMKKYAKIYNKATQKEKPNRPYKKSSSACQYCNLATVCWSESENNEGETV